jgi:hypothetical protein
MTCPHESNDRYRYRALQYNNIVFKKSNMHRRVTEDFVFVIRAVDVLTKVCFKRKALACKNCTARRLNHFEDPKAFCPLPRVSEIQCDLVFPRDPRIRIYSFGLLLDAAVL